MKLFAIALLLSATSAVEVISKGDCSGYKATCPSTDCCGVVTSTATVTHPKLVMKKGVDGNYGN